jgi:hypothetical protein
MAMPPPGRLDEELMAVSPAGDWDAQQLTRLRELRAEVQDLHTVLESVRKGESTLKTYADYVRKTMQDIDELISSIRDGDAIRHLQNSWEQMTVNPLLLNPEAEFPAQEQLHYLDMLASQIQRIVFFVGFLTIPARVNNWLAQARPGYYVPFHLVFDDELPIQEERIRVLNYLAWSPKAIKGGIVDVANGLIYRYADEPKSRRNSFLLLALAFVVCNAIVIGACYVRVPGWPIQPDHLYSFLAGWSAILIGIVTHMGIGSVKRAQAQGGLPPVIAIGDFFMIVNAKAGQILLKLLLALIGFFGFVFGSGVNSMTPFNALLLGYSLDSFIEVFGSSIEQRASAQVATLKKQLGVTN